MTDISAVTAAIRSSVSARDAAAALGLKTDRHGRCACPVHNGQDRNMKLYQGDGGYHCFVCGASGDVIGLVRAVNGCGFREAVEWLDSAFHLGLQIDRPMDKNAQEAAEMARKRRETQRDTENAIARAEYDLYLLAGEIVNALEADAERYQPNRRYGPWDARWVGAVRLLTEAREIAEELEMEAIKKHDQT